MSNPTNTITPGLSAAQSVIPTISTHAGPPDPAVVARDRVNRIKNIITTRVKAMNEIQVALWQVRGHLADLGYDLHTKRMRPGKIPHASVCGLISDLITQEDDLREIKEELQGLDEYWKDIQWEEEERLEKENMLNSRG